MPDPEMPPRLSELLDTIVNRLNDAVKDMEAASQCIQAYKNDPTGAQSCILTYLRSGEVQTSSEVLARTPP